MTVNNYKTAVILARVSSKSQDEEGYSLDSQLKLLRSYCQKNELVPIKEFRIAETASKIQSRKIFHEMLEYVNKNNIYHITVEKTDRLTRNLRDAVDIDDWLLGDGERMLHAVKEGFRLNRVSRSDVKFMWTIQLAVAKKYTDNLREEAMKGWAEKLSQGWLPAVPPPGYKTITYNGKRIHVPDPETSFLMKKAFEMYLDPSHSISSVAVELDRLGLRTRKGRPYAKSHLQRILNNPFYIGINRFDGKDYPGAQETFISKQLFNQVQEKMHAGRPISYFKHNRPLKNLIRCEDCDTVVTWQKQKGKYYGVCKRRNEKCKDYKMLKEDEVEAAIQKQLDDLVSPCEEVINWLCSTVHARYENTLREQRELIGSLDAQINRLNRMEEMLYDDKLAGEITKEKYDEKRRVFAEERSSFEQRKLQIAANAETSIEKRIVVLKLSQKASAIYAKRTPEQKRLIISKLFSDLTLSSGALSVKYTNFTEAIAQRAEKSRQLIGGQK